MSIKTLKARLERGTFVVVADTFTMVPLRGKLMAVASKGPVKCNKHGRCAGDHCKGLAVFVTDPHTAAEGDESPMGWRRNTTKICLTHLLDEDGVPFIAEPDEERRPTAAEQVAEIKRNRIAPTIMPSSTPTPDNGSLVTWDMLAKAVRDGDLQAVSLMARKLKTENEALARRLIECQGRLLRLLQPE